MSWTNIRLIWFREIRDQLRDRRTLFTIAVLPLLLYPVLGMCFLQVTQFMQQHPTRIWLVGTDCLPDVPDLIKEDGDTGQFCFAERFCPAGEANLFQLKIDAAAPDSFRGVEGRWQAQQQIQDDECDAVVVFPADFADQLSDFRARLQAGLAASDSPELSIPTHVPSPEIFVEMSNDKSRIAFDRVDRVLARWRQEIVRENLASNNIPPETVNPFEVSSTDISNESGRRAAVWSKVLPFVVLIWALTGAFYPAIDLCAGEKERGTLETLLCSPAGRNEIVGGKLLTVMTFSAATAMLNLCSMGITGALIMMQISRMPEVGTALNMGPPPLSAIGWLMLAIIPISAMFSGLALAIAAFARSSKEGQYYLMPLLLITLPLVTLPMLPAATLDWGTAIMPVTGMMLWLKALIESEYTLALQFALPVLGVTGMCCWLAILWAVRQFESESVLFREGEQISLRTWMRHLVRDCKDTPTATQAVMGGLVILLITFFSSLRVAPPSSWEMFAWTVVITQVSLIAGPTIIMTLGLTRDPRKTLLLHKTPNPLAVPFAFLTAVSIHPLVMLMARQIQSLYPLSEEAIKSMEPVTRQVELAPTWAVIAVVAVVPALCEELAFRGFILSGLRHIGSKWAAILISAVFFGAAHGMVQQSISAAAVGVLIGYIAVQTDSLLPAVTFHLTHNSLSVLVTRLTNGFVARHPSLEWLFKQSGTEGGVYVYHWPWVVVSIVLAAGAVYWFRRLQHQRTEEEHLYDKLHHQGTTPHFQLDEN